MENASLVLAAALVSLLLLFGCTENNPGNSSGRQLPCCKPGPGILRLLLAGPGAIRQPERRHVQVLPAGRTAARATRAPTAWRKQRALRHPVARRARARRSAATAPKTRRSPSTGANASTAPRATAARATSAGTRNARPGQAEGEGAERPRIITRTAASARESPAFHTGAHLYASLQCLLPGMRLCRVRENPGQLPLGRLRA